MTVRATGPAPVSGATLTALLLGLVHAFVDAASGFVIFRDLASTDLPQSAIVAWVVTYNVLAFGGQVPAGALADRLGSYRLFAVTGTCLAALALRVSPMATAPGILIVGLGNALFHVGAGAHVLARSGDRSRESGVFVGPGAIGLFVGIWLGSQDLPCRWALVSALTIAAPLSFWAARARTIATEPLPKPLSSAWTLALLSAAGLLGSVLVRSLVGGAVAGAWRGVSPGVVALLAGAACLGKLAGGFVGDRLGWSRTTVVALLASTLLLSLFVEHPGAAVLGMLLFQMTMPVTLKAMHHLLPQRPGLAFGLPCLALLVGALPGLYGVRLLPNPWATLGAILGSTVLVTAGLHLLVRSGARGGPVEEQRSAPSLEPSA